jgi:hypothetical protein
MISAVSACNHMNDDGHDMIIPNLVVKGARTNGDNHDRATEITLLVVVVVVFRTKRDQLER